MLRMSRKKSDFQNAAEAQNSLPKLSATGLNGHDLGALDPAES